MNFNQKTSSHSGKTGKTCRRLLFLLLLVFLVLFLFPDEVQKILNELQHTRWQVLALILFLAFLRFVLEGCIIKNAVGKNEGSSCRALSLGNGILCAFYCEFFRLFTLGSGSGIAEIYYLGQQGIQPARGTGISLIQYVIHKATITLYGIAALLLYRKEWAQTLSPYRTAICGGCVLAVGICTGILLIATWKPLSDWLFFLIEKPISRLGKSWPEKCSRWKEQLALLQDEARLLLHEKKRLLRLFLCNLLKFGCLFMIPWFTFSSGSIPFGKSWFLCALIYLLAGVIPAPSGYGSTEFLFLLLYSPFTGSGQAGAAAILLRIAASIAPALIGGMVYLLQKKKRNY